MDLQGGPQENGAGRATDPMMVVWDMLYQAGHVSVYTAEMYPIIPIKIIMEIKIKTCSFRLSFRIGTFPSSSDFP